MTVKELRAALVGLNDDMEVFKQYWDNDWLTDDKLDHHMVIKTDNLDRPVKNDKCDYCLVLS